MEVKRKEEVGEEDEKMQRMGRRENRMREGRERGRCGEKREGSRKGDSRVCVVVCRSDSGREDMAGCGRWCVGGRMGG